MNPVGPGNGGSPSAGRQHERTVIDLPALLAMTMLAAGMARVALAGALPQYVATRFVLPIHCALAGCALLLLAALWAFVRRRVAAGWHAGGAALLVLLPAAVLWWMPHPSVTELMALKKTALLVQRLPGGELPPVPVDADGYRECDLRRVNAELEGKTDTEIARYTYRLSTVGQLVPMPEEEEAVPAPPGAFVVMRFVMVCCFADAQPGGAMVVANRAQIDGTRYDDWVRVRGTVSFRPLPGEDGSWYAWLDDDEIAVIEAPENEFLPPDYSALLRAVPPAQ